MTTNPAEPYRVGAVTTASALTSRSPQRRPVGYSKPVLRVFPPTSERTAKVAMLTVYALMAITIVFIALHEAGFVV
ncbi:hypothetical protein Z051_03460 [Rhodococcus rhodochrous KG-21]|uniref:Uncharacterized protein n=1 Tax=Rhodococcus rhodochrous KG-21 TaxID=1441923 RepID=A0A0M8PLT4_RHORH|nr:hypothetical protein Z051_03460 [Rhodococcus rhodochrous KG-21]